MVGRQVRDDGDVRSSLLPVEVLQLETAEFEHDPVIGTDRVELSQQAAPDVATQPGRLPRCIENGMDHRRGGRLAVAASHGNRAGRTQVPEQSNLGGQPGPGVRRQLQPTALQRHRWIDHDQLGFPEVLGTVFAQPPTDGWAIDAVES